MDVTSHFYSQPSYVGGSGFPVFAGTRRQRGGGILGALAKTVLPVLKSTGKRLLKRAGSEALGLAHDVAQAALSGQGFQGMKRTLREQGMKRLKNVGKSVFQRTVRQPLLPRRRQRKRKRVAAAPVTTGKQRKRPHTNTGRSVHAKRQRRGAGSVVANF